VQNSRGALQLLEQQTLCPLTPRSGSQLFDTQSTPWAQLADKPPLQSCRATHCSPVAQPAVSFDAKAQTPMLPGRLHLSHAPEQASLQHTPSTQRSPAPH
jgi:hypothetical protein